MCESEVNWTLHPISSACCATFQERIMRRSRRPLSVLERQKRRERPDFCPAPRRQPCPHRRTLALRGAKISGTPDGALACDWQEPPAAKKFLLGLAAGDLVQQ